MKTVHVLVIAAAILGAAWILKPAPVEQVSQRALQQREADEEQWQRMLEAGRIKTCLESLGKTAETMDWNDPKQMDAYHRCMWPQEQSWLRRTWNRMISALIW